MSNISKLRDSADFLLNLGKYEEAYNVYDEIYCQIWSALGIVQSGLSEFSFGYLTHDIRSSIEFKNQFLEPVVNTVFFKWFNLDIDQTLNEFIFTVYGHLQCICYSQSLINQFTSATILSEFHVLYNLIDHSTDEKWITYLLRYVSPVIEGSRLKKIRFNLSHDSVNRQLLHLAEKIKFTDWNSLNQFALEYISKTGDKDSEFFKSLQNISGFTNHHSKGNNNRHDRKSNDEKSNSKGKSKQNEKHERSENRDEFRNQKKYENPGKTDAGNDKKQFDPTAASDDEKVRYYGIILGLKGKVTKSDIRKKYIEEISKYHPDKVQNLGHEIVDFAERRTKEINAAYDWLKIKFNF